MHLCADNTQIFGSCQPTATEYWRLHIRAVWVLPSTYLLDAIEPTPTKSWQNWTFAVYLMPASASTANTSTTDRRLFRRSSNVCSKSWYSHRLRSVDADARDENGLAVLQHYVNYVRFATRCLRPYFRLWLSRWCIPGWVTVMQCWLVFLPTCNAIFNAQRSCSVDISSLLPWLYHRCSCLPPLVACSTTHWVQAGCVDLQTSIQPSTALPWASCPCRWPARLASTPLHQHRMPAGIVGQTVICRRLSFSGRCTSYMEWSAKYCSICSVTTLFPAPSRDLSFSTIPFGHHCHTLQ